MNALFFESEELEDVEDVEDEDDPVLMLWVVCYYLFPKA